MMNDILPILLCRFAEDDDREVMGIAATALVELVNNFGWYSLSHNIDILICFFILI